MSDLFIRDYLRDQLRSTDVAGRNESSGDIFSRVLVQRVLTPSGWQERIVAQAGDDGKLVDGDGNLFMGALGVTDGSSASTGQIGEVAQVIFNAVPIPLADGAISSLALSAGDWDVTASINFSADTGSAGWSVVCGLNTSISMPGTPMQATASTAPDSYYGGQSLFLSARQNSASASTVYLVGSISNLEENTGSAWGYIRARRMR